MKNKKHKIIQSKSDSASGYDKRIQQNQMLILLENISGNDEEKLTFFEKIFSIKKCAKNEKQKILTLFGMKFIIKREEHA